MSFLVALQTALDALLKNALRSFLAALGIIIAVGAVVAVVAIGDGARAKVAAQLATLGQNLLVALPGARRTGGVSSGSGGVQTLTFGDGLAIARELSATVAAVAPISRASGQVIHGDANWSTTFLGTTRAFLRVRQWPLQSGEPWNQDDEVGAAKVCLLGATVARQLFGGVDPVQRQIRVRHLPCVVVGVLSPKGQSTAGEDQDDVILMPWATVVRRLNGTQLNSVTALLIEARGAAQMADAEKQVGALLRQRHRLLPGADSDFSLKNLTATQKAADEQARTLSHLLVAVALVSLLVGALGIANVMLVSVTERTREIGIRMAVGARRRDLLAQFLIEATVLSLTGGGIGIGAGIGAARIIALQGGWPTLLSMPAMVAALGLAAVTGLASGLYPALQASRLDPIIALKFE
jgi:putative ABC transport system permease protein